MREQPRPLVSEQKLSRRELFRRGRNAIAAAAIAAAAYKLNEGISLRQPPVVLKTVSVGRINEGVQLFSEVSPEADGKRPITITPEGELLFEPSGEFFAPGREFSYIHRANSIEVIHRAHSMGANLFDIDANDVNGTLYGEHGIVPQFDLSLGRLNIELQLPAVIDQNEAELKLGMPNDKYEELVACVASLSTAEQPLAVSTELKRGKFELDTLNKMLGIHQRYNVPAILYSPDPSQLEVMGNKIAQSYNAAK